MSQLTIFSDGAARGNPGPAGAGASITDETGAVVGEVCQYLGETTNNQAEYRALLLALEEAKKLSGKRLALYADSELMVKQIRGEYRVKNADLKQVYLKVKTLLADFEGYTIEHVRREKNKDADALANRAIDEKD